MTFFDRAVCRKSVSPGLSEFLEGVVALVSRDAEVTSVKMASPMTRLAGFVQLADAEEVRPLGPDAVFQQVRRYAGAERSQQVQP